MAPHYRKKRQVVEALRWGMGDDQEVLDWLCELKMDYGICPSWLGSALVLPSPVGPMTAEPGDWVIRGQLGEVYPCKPHAFEALFEVVI